MTRLPTIFLASTLLSTIAVVPSFAQQDAPAAAPAPAAPVVASPPVTAPPAAAPSAAKTQMDRADDDRQRREAAYRDAMFEAHLAALHAGLALTPEQQSLWPPVESAIRGFVKMRGDMRDRRADMRQDAGDGDGQPIEQLKQFAQNELERAKALDALATAAEPLYAALDQDQKHRVPTLLLDMVPRRGPLADAIERLADTDHPHGDAMGPEHGRRHWERGAWDGHGGGWGWRTPREGADRDGPGDDRRAAWGPDDRGEND